MTTKDPSTLKLFKRKNPNEFFIETRPLSRSFKSFKNCVLELSPKMIKKQAIRRLKTSLWRLNQKSTTGQEALKTLRSRFCFARKRQKLRFDFYFYWSVLPQELDQIRRVLQSTYYLQDFCLKTSAMQRITDEDLWQISEGLKRRVFLRRLSLCFGRCEEITDEGFEEISGCLRRLVLLKNFSLILTFSKEITDGGICTMGKALKRLIYLQRVSLEFSCCSGVQTQGIEFLYKCIKQLPFFKKMSLNIRDCVKIDVDSLRKLK